MEDVKLNLDRSAKHHGDQDFSMFLHYLEWSVCMPWLTCLYIGVHKNVERKKKEQIQGRTKRKRLVLNPVIQPSGHMMSYWRQWDIFTLHWCQSDVILASYACWEIVFVNYLYTKYELSIPNRFGDIFEGWMEGQMDRWNESWTDVNPIKKELYDLN